VRIVIMGSGAIGGLYGGLLSLSGEDVILLVGRKRQMESIHDSGLRITGILGDHELYLDVAEDPKDIHRADLVFITTKAYDTIEAASQIRHLVDGGAYVLCLQNGLDTEVKVADYLGTTRVLRGTTCMGALVTGPGEITATGCGITEIGSHFPENREMVDKVVKRLKQAGFDVRLSDNIEGVVWTKTIVNCGINPIGALTGLTNGEIHDDMALRNLVVKLVEEAEASKAPVQRFADSFASRFVPLVLLLAALVAILSQSVVTAVSVIVVACPCAVAIATPLAVVASVGKAAKGGIIIKGGAYLEELSRVTTVVFDKTGTITLGEPRVTDVKGFDDHDDRDIITFAAIAELHSEHHLADAVARKALEYDAKVPAHQSCQIVAGKGVICEYADTTIIMGNRDLMTDNDLDVPQTVEKYMREREDEGKTTMIIVHDHHVCGVISVADVVRKETVEGLKELRRLGIQEFIMMTGDTTRAAKAIAKQVGVDEVMAEMLPQDKVEAVRDLVKQGKTVLMVGDGVNDAPAIAEASVGAAMGVAGSDVAIETADVVLMTDDFRNIAQAIRIGKRAVTNIKENIGASILFNVLGIALASIGVLSPIMAAAVHALPDIILFLNASRLLK